MTDFSELYEKNVSKIPGLIGQGYFLPRNFVPTISKKDIDNEYVDRYFAMQANQNFGEVYEVSPQMYQRLRGTGLYKTVKIRWRIAGKIDDITGGQNINTPVRLYTGVKTANQLQVEDAEKLLPGISSTLGNPLQFYKGRG